LILAGHPFLCTGVSDYSKEREGVGGGRERKRKREGGKEGERGREKRLEQKTAVVVLL